MRRPGVWPVRPRGLRSRLAGTGHQEKAPECVLADGHLAGTPSRSTLVGGLISVRAAIRSCWRTPSPLDSGLTKPPPGSRPRRRMSAEDEIGPAAREPRSPDATDEQPV